MAKLEQIQLLAQLVDSIENSTDKLEKSYQENNGEIFEKAKKTILDFSKKISEIIEETQK